MKGYKQCEKGHYFKEELSECPYCPKGSPSSSVDDKTKIQGGDMTQVGDKTQIFGGGSAQPPSIQVTPSAKRDLNKTFIQEVEEQEVGGVVKEVVHQRSTRKIVGWLISYSLDPMGIDFRLFEGNNTLGRNPGNDVTIAGDPSISGHHATILFKKGNFYIKDEMAANGTFIDGEELSIGQPYEMSDGCEIRLGNSVFKFKTPL